jgi:hypothetical protein
VVITNRNQNLEIVRIASAFGIVLFHAGAPSAEIGYSGLIAFTVLATYFAKFRPAKLASRILLPWAFWSVAYIAFRFVLEGRLFPENMDPIISILYGTHLWFLPFIFVAILFVSAVEVRWLPEICALAALVLLAATPWWRDFQLSFGPPFAQYFHALAAALIGVGIRTKWGRITSAVGLAICYFWGVEGVSVPYALGGGIVIAALSLPDIKIDVQKVSSNMMGVYLVHGAALLVTFRLFGYGSELAAIAAFVGSLAGVWIARRLFPPSSSVLG